MLVPDVSVDPRYIKVVDDVRSELVIPLLLKDRCIGVFDLEATELNAFNKRHVEILSLLASQAAVAIENARLYETILANELRMEKELRFAQRVQARAAAGGSAQAAQGRRRRGAIHAGARAGRRSLRLPGTRTEQSWLSPSATCRAKGCRPRSTARSSASWSARGRSAGASPPTDRARRASWPR